jgi:hypothetical protein
MFGRTELVIAAAVVLMAALSAAFVVKDRQIASLRADKAALEVALATTKQQHAEERAAAAERALFDYTAMEKRKDEALKVAEARAEALAAAGARARAESARLRDALARAGDRVSSAPEASVREYAATVTSLLGSCQDEYRAVAEKADGHASDVRTLMEAWPGVKE